MKKSIIPVFPGTNCEKESALWLYDHLDTQVEFLDIKVHGALTAQDLDMVLIPGGFSYGDYLRAGAIAARSPEMQLIKSWAAQGVPVLGICNGFQILCESGLLPGCLVKNVTRSHHHFPVSVRVDPDVMSTSGSKTCAWIPKWDAAMLQPALQEFSSFLLPMSCGMGNWRPPRDPVAQKQALEGAVLYYNNNENGSFQAVAGLMNADGNVLGLMPHPERASDPILGSTQGLFFLYGIGTQRYITMKEPLLRFSKSRGIL